MKKESRKEEQPSREIIEGLEEMVRQKIQEWMSGVKIFSTKSFQSFLAGENLSVWAN
jgi:hypothetical protein